jgi:hypothetical protein
MGAAWLLRSALFLAALTAAVAPVPTVPQLELMDLGLASFMHFSVDTFSDGVEHNCVGTKSDCLPASLFNPKRLDTDQWVQAARAMGAGEICLVEVELIGNEIHVFVHVNSFHFTDRGVILLANLRPAFP